MDGKAESSPKSTGSFEPPARPNRGSPVAEDRRKDFLVLHRPARFVCLIPLNRVDITGVPSGRLFCNRPQGHSHRHKTDRGHHSQHRKKVSIDHFASLRHCTKSTSSSVVAGLGQHRTAYKRQSLAAWLPSRILVAGKPASRAGLRFCRAFRKRPTHLLWVPLKTVLSVFCIRLSPMI